MISLNDKTIVLAGPYGLLLQNLTSRLVERGADVALITNDGKSAQRICQNLMDMREVSEKFGRAAVVESTVTGEKDAENNFSRSAELFGSTDVYIDTYLYGLNLPLHTQSKLGDVDGSFKEAFQKSLWMTQNACTFLKSRSKGRILYLCNELDMWTAEKAESSCFKNLSDHVHKLALELATQNTTVNALALGVSEEYLLSHFAKNMTIQQALKELAKTIPHARLVDYVDISNITSFLVSPMSSGINGQVIRVNNGL